MSGLDDPSQERSSSRSLRRFKSFAEQDAATFLYWRDKTKGERMEATAELVRSGYGVRGIDADVEGSKNLLFEFNAAGVEYLVIGQH